MTIHHGVGVQQWFGLLFALLFVLYITAVLWTNGGYKKWPAYRTICWSLSMACAVLALVGPIAERAHHDFTMHMISHLLLGMLAPLLMAMASPVTLLLRTIRTSYGRVLMKLLKSSLARVITNPFIALPLNIGGLWLLYTTSLYSLMQENAVIHFIVHMHVLLAGYLFTISIIYMEPLYHRTSFLYRAIMLIVALAGHGILAKYMFTHPPQGVSLQQAEQGSIVMYYGGDIIDAVIIIIFCLQWFKATKPRIMQSQQNAFRQ